MLSLLVEGAAPLGNQTSLSERERGSPTRVQGGRDWCKLVGQPRSPQSCLLLVALFMLRGSREMVLANSFVPGNVSLSL